MILKPYEITKINKKTQKIILGYGNNEGQKKEVISKISENESEFLHYEQNEILDNENIFFDNIYSKSLFENKKTIIVRRVTDKFINIIEGIKISKLDNVLIVLNAENLEKKSKLRIKFEKDKNLISTAFYPDNQQTLANLASIFFKKNKISISYSILNSIVNKCNGDREILHNELEKIKLYTLNGKKIDNNKILKLVNLIENYSVSELADNYLDKNNKKTMSILNENNFNSEDCVLITRIFLNKSKRLLKLCSDYKINRNLDETIKSAKPPIFWKDKEITKNQITKWQPEDIKKLIYKLNEIEFLIKKNMNNSINIITDFLLNYKKFNH